MCDQPSRELGLLGRLIAAMTSGSNNGAQLTGIAEHGKRCQCYATGQICVISSPRPLKSSRCRFTYTTLGDSNRQHEGTGVVGVTGGCI